MAFSKKGKENKAAYKSGENIRFKLFTVHFPKYESKDEYIECTVTEFTDIIKKADKILKSDRTVELVKIYEKFENKKTGYKAYIMLCYLKDNCLYFNHMEKIFI